MNRSRILAVCTVLLLTTTCCVQAEVLRGQLSGLDESHTRFDLRIRFFESDDTGELVAEREFSDVELRHGRFAVSLASIEIPLAALFVEIALRPNARPYSIFRTIPPRQRIDRVGSGVLVAAIPPQTAARQPAAAAFEPIPAALVRPGEL